MVPSKRFFFQYFLITVKKKKKVKSFHFWLWSKVEKKGFQKGIHDITLSLCDDNWVMKKHAENKKQNKKLKAKNIRVRMRWKTSAFKAVLLSSCDNQCIIADGEIRFPQFNTSVLQPTEPQYCLKEGVPTAGLDILYVATRLFALSSRMSMLAPPSSWKLS